MSECELCGGQRNCARSIDLVQVHVVSCLYRAAVRLSHNLSMTSIDSFDSPTPTCTAVKVPR